jgi:hypothetical protein
MLTPDIAGVRVRQFFSEGAHEEAELLDLYTDLISKADVIFSYNGDQFDIPFVNARLAARHRPPAFSECLSVDMYRVVRSHSKLRSMLPNLKQKTVEDYLGLWSSRDDRISGADSVKLYYEYLAAKSPELLNYILLHNCDDLRQLARILGIFGGLDLHEIASSTGFPVVFGESVALVDRIQLKANVLEYSGRYRTLPFEYIVFDENFHASFDNDANTFEVVIPCGHEKDLIFADIAGFGALADELSDDPSCASGYLVLKRDRSTNFSAVNRLVKLSLKSLLSKFSG